MESKEINSSSTNSSLNHPSNQSSNQSFSHSFNPVTSYGSGIKTDLKDFSLNTFEEKINLSSLNQTFNLPKEIKKYSLTTVPKQYFKYFSLIIPEDENAINQMHYHTIKKSPQNIIFLIIPKNINPSEPLTITIDITTGSTSSHLIIIAEENSSATIIETTTSSKETYALTSFKEIIIAQNATLNYFQTHHLHNNTYYLSKSKTIQSQNSKYKLYDHLNGGNSIQHHNSFHLQEQSATAHHFLAFNTSNNADYDLVSESQQLAPSTECKLICKGLIEDQAKALFQGKVNIGSKAKNAKGEQRTDLLLIGDKAKGEAVPILNVQNNDINCIHAATIAQMTDEHLFYLTSRGLNQTQAKEMIIAGFLAPILDLFPKEK